MFESTSSKVKNWNHGSGGCRRIGEHGYRSRRKLKCCRQLFDCSHTTHHKKSD
ncbi:MAG: hypothetical protein RIR26_2219, partial [Pseudomonadota bacterium]